METLPVYMPAGWSRCVDGLLRSETRCLLWKAAIEARLGMGARTEGTAKRTAAEVVWRSPGRVAGRMAKP